MDHIRAGTTTNNSNNNSASATVVGPSSSNHNRDDDKKKFSSSAFFAAAWSTPLLRNQFGAHPAANKPRFVHSAPLHHHHHHPRSSKTPRRSSPDSTLALFRVQMPTRMVMTTAAVFLLLPLLLFLWKEMGFMMTVKHNHHGKLLADLETADAAHRLRKSRHKQAQPAWMEEGILTTTTTDQDSGRTNTSTRAATIISGNETTATMTTTLRKNNLTSSSSSELPTSLAFDADNHTKTSKSKSSKSSKEAVILSSTESVSVNTAPDATTPELNDDPESAVSSTREVELSPDVTTQNTAEPVSSSIDRSSASEEEESSIQQEESGSKILTSSETSKSSKTTSIDSLKDENEDEQLEGKNRRDSTGEASEVDPAGNRNRRRLIRQRRRTLVNSTRTFQ